MIAMHWYPDMRQRTEQPLLDAFHNELLAHGVTGYDRRALQDDYRLSVLWQTTRPIWMRAVRIPPSIWWEQSRTHPSRCRRSRLPGAAWLVQPRRLGHHLDRLGLARADAERIGA
jgi:hypothetical protein